jgi:HEAT repeat protein
MKAAQVLATLHDTRAADGLVAALARDPYAYVRASAARALGQLLARQENDGVRSALHAAATQDVDEGVRAAANEGLGIRPTGAGRAAGP